MYWFIAIYIMKQKRLSIKIPRLAWLILAVEAMLVGDPGVVALDPKALRVVTTGY